MFFLGVMVGVGWCVLLLIGVAVLYRANLGEEVEYKTANTEFLPDESKVRQLNDSRTIARARLKRSTQVEDVFSGRR